MNCNEITTMNTTTYFLRRNENELLPTVALDSGGVQCAKFSSSRATAR